MSTKQSIPKWHYAVLFLIVCMAFLHYNNENFRLGHNISIDTDGWTEANCYRAALNYNRDGFTSRAGLPQLYGNDFNDYGAMQKYTTLNLAPPDKAYTHYPPGMCLLFGVMTMIFGPGKMPFYRLLPTILALVSVGVLGISLLKLRFHVAGVILFTLGLLAMPAFGKWVPSMSVQSYNASFWLIFIAIYLQLLFKGSDQSTKWSSRYSYSFIALGLVQGYLGFDWFFIACFSTIPIWFFHAHFTAHRSLKKLVKPTLQLVIGFTLAHLIHFIQKCFYFGGIEKTLSDLMTTAYHRSHGNVNYAIPKYLLGPINSMIHCISKIQGEPYLFPNYFLTITIMVIVSLSFAKRLLGRETATKNGALLQFRIDSRTLWMFVSALIVSSLWMLLMPQHAIMHLHFVGHHFLLYYVILLFFFLFVLEPNYQRLYEAAIETLRTPKDLIHTIFFEKENSTRYLSQLITKMQRVFTGQPGAVAELFAIAMLSTILLLSLFNYSLSEIIILRSKINYMSHLPKCHEDSISLLEQKHTRDGESYRLSTYFVPACQPSGTVYLRINARQVDSITPLPVFETPVEWKIGLRNKTDIVFQTKLAPEQLRLSLFTKWTDNSETPIPITYKEKTETEGVTIQAESPSQLLIDR